MSRSFALTVSAMSLCMSAPALAGWKLVPHDTQENVGGMILAPSSDWNRASDRPGKQATAWTHDGFDLNELDIFTAVPSGQSLFRERDAKRNPMPKFENTMLLLDLADLFERSFRARRDVADFTILEAKPSKLAGHPAVSLRFSYLLADDELVRNGEARLAIANKAFYAISFQAPQLHYFDAGLNEARTIMDTVKLAGE